MNWYSLIDTSKAIKPEHVTVLDLVNKDIDLDLQDIFRITALEPGQSYQITRTLLVVRTN